MRRCATLLPMQEFTPHQMKVLERLFAAGFRPIAIPPYENALCVRRGDCAALLTPAGSTGLRLLASPTYIVEGNLSVKLKRGKEETFVWKKTELPATPERLRELEAFRQELTSILDEAPPQ
jgi:hypothetical protein